MTQKPPSITVFAAGLLTLALTLCTASLAQAPQAPGTKAAALKAKAVSAAGSKDATASKGTSQTASAYSGPPVLDPSNFYGSALVGYAAAKAAPEVVSQLFCYCGCDISDKHKRLIDCFTSNHGVDCHICQEEATLALKLSRAETPIAEIQKQVDEQYSHDYPFQEESANLKQYKATRLWKENSQSQGDKPKASSSTRSFDISEKGFAGQTLPERQQTKGARLSASNSALKLKPGFHIGSCCAPESGN